MFFKNKIHYYILPLIVVVLGNRIESLCKAIKTKENISMEVVFFITVLGLSVFVLFYP